MGNAEGTDSLGVANCYGVAVRGESYRTFGHISVVTFRSKQIRQRGVAGEAIGVGYNTISLVRKPGEPLIRMIMLTMISNNVMYPAEKMQMHAVNPNQAFA